MAEEVCGAFAVLLERVEGDGEAGFGGDGLEFEVDGKGHALHLEVHEGGFGGGAAAFAPEEAGHVEDELVFEGTFGMVAAEEVVVERLELGGVLAFEEELFGIGGGALFAFVGFGSVGEFSVFGRGELAEVVGQCPFGQHA